MNPIRPCRPDDLERMFEIVSRRCLQPVCWTPPTLSLIQFLLQEARRNRVQSCLALQELKEPFIGGR
jgi:hypothetical protein